MIVIKTDEELWKEYRDLTESQRRLTEIYNGMINDRNNLMDIWRAETEPLVKRAIHHEIWDLDHKISCGFIKWELERVNINILEVSRYLFSKPSPQYGCIYDTYRELDYDKIQNYGIDGVKL